MADFENAPNADVAKMAIAYKMAELCMRNDPDKPLGLEYSKVFLRRYLTILKSLDAAYTDDALRVVDELS